MAGRPEEALSRLTAPALSAFRFTKLYEIQKRLDVHQVRLLCHPISLVNGLRYNQLHARFLHFIGLRF